MTASDENYCWNRKFNIIQKSFDHAYSITVITGVITCMIVGEENYCVNFLRPFVQNTLVENFILANLVVEILFIYKQKMWMAKGINGDQFTASNTDGIIIVLNKILSSKII